MIYCRKDLKMIKNIYKLITSNFKSFEDMETHAEIIYLSGIITGEAALAYDLKLISREQFSEITLKVQDTKISWENKNLSDNK